MDWKEKMKNNRLVAPVLYVVTALIGLGAIAGAINDLFDLAQRVDLSDDDGWLPRAYVQVSDWLSATLTIPVWLMLPILALAAGVAYLLLRQRSQLSDVSQELDKLKSPGFVALDSTDERVLFWVKRLYDRSSSGMGPTPAAVADSADMPLSNVEASVDVLKQADLLKLKKLKSDPLDLTSKGRGYFKPSDVQSRYAIFEVNLWR